MSKQSRRNFFRNASLGAAGIGMTSFSNADASTGLQKTNNAREVWIASLTQHQIGGETFRDAIAAAVKQMENAVPYSPDIYCLPEVFHVIGLKEGPTPLDIIAENGSGNIIAPFQAFAKKHQCYIICPIYTVDQGKYYNAAVVIDRKGQRIGEYRKARLTVDEMEYGLTPGPIEPPIFELDMGVVGIQICYDIEWQDGWKRLKEKGAELVFWPSAFGAGKKINTKAWENQYCVVASTRKGTTKICDITGEELAISGIWNPWGVCAPVNLEKVYLHSWPYSLKFPEIVKKYGRKVKCYSLHEEEISVIESLSPDLKVADILKEFNLLTYQEHLKIAQDQQEKLRV